MLYSLYSIRDNKSDFYAPRIEINQASAVRNFAQMVNTSGTLLNFSPSDFVLYEIGQFDSEKGILISFDVAKFVISGSDLIGVGNYEK